MIVVIDNYDSFTYNLVQYLGEMGARISVFRNDEVTINKISSLNPTHLLISPGPCSPHEAGKSNEIIAHFSGKLPLLGVCLGHQCIGHVFGGRIVRAERIMHGKVSQIYHTKKGLFKGVPSPFEATRYHSLLIAPDSVPSVLTVVAWTKEKEIMGVKHRTHPTWGVQFHPESILTQHGKKIVKNFLEM